MLGRENVREENRWTSKGVYHDEGRINRELESPEDFRSLLVVYPCKGKSLERALLTKSSEPGSTPALY